MNIISLNDTTYTNNSKKYNFTAHDHIYFIINAGLIYNKTYYINLDFITSNPGKLYFLDYIFDINEGHNTFNKIFYSNNNLNIIFDFKTNFITFEILKFIIFVGNKCKSKHFNITNFISNSTYKSIKHRFEKNIKNIGIEFDVLEKIKNLEINNLKTSKKSKKKVKFNLDNNDNTINELNIHIVTETKTENIKNTVIENTENIVTENTENTVTENIENTVTENTVTVIENTVTVTENTENIEKHIVTENTKNTENTENNKNTVTENTENTEKIIVTTTDKLITEKLSVADNINDFLIKKKLIKSNSNSNSKPVKSITTQQIQRLNNILKTNCKINECIDYIIINVKDKSIEYILHMALLFYISYNTNNFILHINNNNIINILNSNNYNWIIYNNILSNTYINEIKSDNFIFDRCQLNNNINRTITQCHISKSLLKFKNKFMKEFKLFDYYSIQENCVFFGCYDLIDFNYIYKHRGKIIIIWGGTDINTIDCKTSIGIDISFFQKRTDILHIAISKQIFQQLIFLKFKNIKKIHLKLLDYHYYNNCNKKIGDSVYIYTSLDTERAKKIYGKDIYQEVMNKLKNINFIIAYGQYSDNEMINIYQKCAIG